MTDENRNREQAFYFALGYGWAAGFDGWNAAEFEKWAVSNRGDQFSVIELFTEWMEQR